MDELRPWAGFAVIEAVRCFEKKGIFEALERPATPQELGARLGLPVRPLELTLPILATLGYLDRRGDTFRRHVDKGGLEELPRLESFLEDGEVGDQIDRLAGARVELWHADAVGSVDESRYRALQMTDRRGQFGIKTVLPGHIERARGNAVFAPRHIHVVVTHADYEQLISLIYFKGDERLEGGLLVLTLDAFVERAHRIRVVVEVTIPHASQVAGFIEQPQRIVTE